MVRTSGVSGRPSVISISPLPSGVTLGYQRPRAMSGPRDHELVAGLKLCVCGIPFRPESLLPPARNMEPSGRCASPLQKTLKPVSTLTSVCVSVAGSHTVARVWSWTGNVSVAASPTESYASTLPFGSSATCTPTTGQSSTAPHWPTRCSSPATAAAASAASARVAAAVLRWRRASSAGEWVTESSAAWAAGPSNPWCADARNGADNRQTRAKAAASPKRTSTYSQ